MEDCEVEHRQGCFFVRLLYTHIAGGYFVQKSDDDAYACDLSHGVHEKRRFCTHVR
jgi:hypothetical protein